MCNEPRRRLLKETNRFREWVDANSEPFGAWEPEIGVADDDVFDALMQFIRACPDGEWYDEVVNSVLYLVARDDEPEYLADVLAENPVLLLTLARGALGYPEAEARWQLAARLGDLHEHLSEAEPLLVRFTQDDNEYVCRRAIMALGRLGSTYVEQIAESAWSTGHQYQQMAVLSALYETGSPKLREYLDRAIASGCQYVVSLAREIEFGSAS